MTAIANRKAKVNLDLNAKAPVQVQVQTRARGPVETSPYPVTRNAGNAVPTLSLVRGARYPRGSMRVGAITHGKSICDARWSICMPPGCMRWQNTWSEWPKEEGAVPSRKLGRLPRNQAWTRSREAEYRGRQRVLRAPGKLAGRDRCLGSKGGPASGPRRNAFDVNSAKYGNSSRNWSESSIA